MTSEVQREVQAAIETLLGKGQVVPGIPAAPPARPERQAPASPSPEQIALALTVAIIRTPEQTMAPAEAVRIYRDVLAELQASAQN